MGDFLTYLFDRTKKESLVVQVAKFEFVTRVTWSPFFTVESGLINETIINNFKAYFADGVYGKPISSEGGD